MRPYYWALGDKADMDDEHLSEAIVEELVPSGCLLGGHLVRQLSDAGERVCDWCPCPKREVCGGTPKIYDLDKDEGEIIKHPSGRIMRGDEKSARRQIRDSFIATLNELCADEAD